MDSFEDRGYHWAEITNTTDTIGHQRVFVRGARLDVPGSKIEQLADELDKAANAENDDRASSSYVDAADRLRGLLT